MSKAGITALNCERAIETVLDELLGPVPLGITALNCERAIETGSVQQEKWSLPPYHSTELRAGN